MKQRAGLNEISASRFFTHRFQALEAQLSIMVQHSLANLEMDFGDSQRTRQRIVEQFIGIYVHVSPMFQFHLHVDDWRKVPVALNPRRKDERRILDERRPEETRELAAEFHGLQNTF